MNFEYVDNIYRSRLTLLNILEERGFDIEKYRKFSPVDISVAVEEFPGLGFSTSKKDDPEYTLQVLYSRMSRQKLEQVLLDPDMDPRPSEMIIMILEPVTDIHHLLALKAFTSNKLHVSIFSIPNLTFDPRTHIMVPKHKIVPQEEVKDILERWNLTSKTQMPMIRYHVDPIVRILGGVIGDVIEITRPSPTAGTYTFYRVVSP